MTESRDRQSLRHLETIYGEHPAVNRIAVFTDQLGQVVALVVSEMDEEHLQRALQSVASDRLPGHLRIVDLVVLWPGDPLLSALFPPGGPPRRDLIWQFLVGSIPTLAASGSRFCETCRQALRSPTNPESRHCHDLALRSSR